MKYHSSSSMDRVLAVFQHKVPDRVPLLLTVTMHGAKELGLSIQEYFSKAEYVAEGQVRMLKKYRADFLFPFYFAAAEFEAWGGQVIFREDGPPNAGEPIINHWEDIISLSPPSIRGSKNLQRNISTIKLLKEAVGDSVPIVGVITSPFSLPAMQMGFGSYIELLYKEPRLFNVLMQANKQFCADWANAQLDAGATAIAYFDPISSCTIIPPEIYLKTGYQVARQTLPLIKGPTITHMGSGRSLPILDHIAATGTQGIAVSALESLREIKKQCSEELILLGNLNAVEMCRWTQEKAERTVKEALAKGGPGGSFIVTDNHGEIPWQVPEEILMAISEAVHKWGRYPLDWVKDYES